MFGRSLIWQRFVAGFAGRCCSVCGADAAALPELVVFGGGRAHGRAATHDLGIRYDRILVITLIAIAFRVWSARQSEMSTVAAYRSSLSAGRKSLSPESSTALRSSLAPLPGLLRSCRWR